ncbi:MAG: DNA repair protein RecO [Clostridia bacterium]|nr:DNA repair protein RecO [Clostridia bacterium]
MLETIRGVILRETAIGDYDKIMTVLTAEHGRISVYAKGAKRLKSPIFTATQLFSYSEMTIAKSNETYYLRVGELIESFYRLRETLEGAALASYVADVAADIAVEGQPCTDLCRLVLNTFHAIAMQKKPVALIKGVFELRISAIAGFVPNLVACGGCGSSDSDVLYFDVSGGIFYCEECYRQSAALAEALASRRCENEGIYPTGQLISILSSSVFAAMRYAVYSRAERIFSFELKDEALADFARVAEHYLVCHLERSYATLEFYHAVAS